MDGVCEADKGACIYFNIQTSLGSGSGHETAFKNGKCFTKSRNILFICKHL